MEQSISLGMLALMMSAPCAVGCALGWALGWALGDHARARRAAPRPEGPVPRAVRLTVSGPKSRRGIARLATRRPRNLPRDLFADMPSLPELAREIAAIRSREPLWDAQQAGRLAGADLDERAVLDHHRGVIGELAAMQIGMGAAPLVDPGAPSQRAAERASPTPG